MINQLFTQQSNLTNLLELYIRHTIFISMFDIEKKKASFNVQELSYLLYEGKDHYDEFQKILSLFHNDPIMTYDPSFLSQSRADVMTTLAKKLLRFHNYYPLDGINEVLKSHLFCHQLPLSLHGMMFLTTLKNLCDAEQQKVFLEPALRGQIIGCYAQTQLAHGSDVQNLLTTATYDSSSETFIINTPEVGAAKWWIGDLGLYCNHAALFAQLIINGKRYGVHAFLVPIRDPITLKPLRGIEVGDIGPKNGFQSKDNGYVIFNNIRIPRKNMLMRYHVVSKQGAYSLQGDQKISYATMLMTRSGITKILSNAISKIITIGVRYSLLRTQFKNSKGEQIPVLNYQTQQEKIIPRIAQSYATWFVAKNINELSNSVFQDAKRGKFDRLNQAHILTSATKAILSYDVLRGAEIVRRSAGGHGFHFYNGMIAIQQQSTPLFTLQGQFTILLLQVGRFLIKSLGNLQKGKPLVQSVKYLEEIGNNIFQVPIKSLQSLDCPYLIQKILVLHSCKKLKNVAQKYAALLDQKFTVKEIEDHQAGILVNEAAIAHSYVIIYGYFLKQVEKVSDQKIKTVLKKLLLLYGIEKIIERSAKFYETSTLTPQSFSLLYQRRQNLFEELRPQSLGLVQAFGYNDSILMSAIAASNGKPYENLIQWAQKYNTLNRKQERSQVVTAIKKAKSQLRPRI